MTDKKTFGSFIKSKRIEKTIHKKTWQKCCLLQRVL